MPLQGQHILRYTPAKNFWNSLAMELNMTPEDKPVENNHDDADGLVDAIAGSVLVSLFVITAVFWVSQQ